MWVVIMFFCNLVVILDRCCSGILNLLFLWWCMIFRSWFWVSISLDIMVIRCLSVLMVIWMFWLDMLLVVVFFLLFLVLEFGFVGIFFFVFVGVVVVGLVILVGVFMIFLIFLIGFVVVILILILVFWNVCFSLMRDILFGCSGCLRVCFVGFLVFCEVLVMFLVIILGVVFLVVLLLVMVVLVFVDIVFSLLISLLLLFWGFLFLVVLSLFKMFLIWLMDIRISEIVFCVIGVLLWNLFMRVLVVCVIFLSWGSFRKL